MEKIKVLYEDNHLIAVFKPAGVLVQGDISGDRSLMDFTKEYLKEKYKKEGNVFLGLIHRLDRNVSGIVLFAKTSKGASRLSEQFRLHTVQKIYHAWVQGKIDAKMKKSGTLTNYLLHNESSNSTKVVDEKTPGAQLAELSYEVVQVQDNKILVKIFLKTGRQHQIRAQFSHIGHPVVGDVKYGAAKAFPDQHLALYATELQFTTATGDEQKIVSIPVPEESW